MNKSTKKKLYNTALICLVVIAAGSGLTIVSRLLAKQKNDAALEALSDSLAGGRENIQIRTDGGSAGDEPSGEDGKKNGFTPEEAILLRKERLPGYQNLKDKNSDTVGFVSIPGTKIDYPVMQTPETPDYYLKHNFDRQKSAYGAPYAAEDCELGQAGGVILYGHHMKDGSMFAALSGYTDEAFYKEHPWFWFDTLKDVGLYRIIGVCTASAEGRDPLFGMARTENEQEYEDYVAEIKRRSFYDTGVSASWGEPLVTLMTCEYTTREGRLFVVGKKYQKDGGDYTDETDAAE